VGTSRCMSPLMLSLLAFSTSASARAAESNPTIVLVHGAFASPAGWDGVAAALHKDGFQTATPALGLASVSEDVAIVQSTLDSIPGDKILVGHSYGGFVITNAASAIPTDGHRSRPVLPRRGGIPRAIIGRLRANQDAASRCRAARESWQRR
jgi:pimeloyl-ACP methyl ester carboxylesterase